MTQNTIPTTEQAWREAQRQIDKLFLYLVSEDIGPIPDTAKTWAEHIITTYSPDEVQDIWARIGVTKLFLTDLDKNIRLQAPTLFRRRALMVDQATAGEETQK